MKANLLLPKAVVIILCSCLLFPNNLNAQPENMLYGLTAGGGDGAGVIFHIDRTTGIQTVDYSFPVLINGKYSYSDLTDDGNGKFYGMTNGGGSNGYGVIFEWDPIDNIYTKKIDFDNIERGRNPMGSLTLSGGKFYGMTSYGGTNDVGVIFEWDPITNIFSKKLDFEETANGSSPNGSLILSEGRFYGMTTYGGENGAGVIFEWDPAKNDFKKRIDFNGAYGTTPLGSLAYSDGKFYGMTWVEGSNGNGTIFEWDPSTNIFTKRIDFGGLTNSGNPCGSLTLRSGKFYGMTSSFGTNGCGVIFEWDPITNIFIKKIDFEEVTKGKSPYGSLTLSGDKFYGMTFRGGTSNNGVFFEWDPSNNTFIKKIDFDGTSKGSNPYFQSLTTSGGKLYGMTSTGGMASAGVIFEWDPTNNTYTKKIDFNEAPNGRLPYNSLTFSGGKFYGMTYEGGSHNVGVIFEWDPAANSYNKKIDFDGTNGSNPYGALTLNNGKFYGMTYNGGTKNNGIIFEWDPSTNIYTKKIDLDSTSGHNPFGSLTLNDGKFYGMALSSETIYNSVIFEWDPATNIFIKSIDVERTGWRGTIIPGVSLTFSDGKFYGRYFEAYYDDYSFGSIFEWNLATNMFTKKIDFDGLIRYPWSNGSLALSNGKFYGMTSEGDANTQGTIFEWDPTTNIYTKKIDFDGKTKGSYPYGSLTLCAGKFYGMTSQGGANDLGIIFEWDPLTNTYSKLLDFNGINGSSPWYTYLTLYSIEVPIKQTSNISFSDVQTNQMTFNWTPGNGEKRTVFIKKDNIGSAFPDNNTTYIADTSFGTGTQIGTTGWYCVFNGTNNTSGITVKNLLPNTIYQVMACEYNGIVSTEQYNTTIALNNPKSQQTATILIPAVDSISSLNLCNGAVEPAINFTSTPAGSVFSWTSTQNVGFGISGTGNIASFTATNTSNNEVSATVSVTAALNGSVSPVMSFTVIVNPTSDGGMATAESLAVCLGNSTTLSLTGYTGSLQWQQSADESSGWLNVTIGSGVTSTTYTTPNLYATTWYRASVKSGVCTTSYSASAKVTVNPLPKAPIASVTAQPNCSTATGTIAVSEPLPEEGISFSIDGTTYTNTTGIFTLVLPDSYDVTVKNKDGCISLATAVTVNTQPVTPNAPLASVTSQPTCTVATGSITITEPLPEAGVSYSVDGVNYTNKTGVFSGVISGTYNITVKNVSGCFSSATTVTVNPQPLTPDAPIASVTVQPLDLITTGTITITAPLPAVGIYYSINGLDYENITGIFTGVLPGAYQVTVKIDNGCISAAAALTVNPYSATGIIEPIASEPKVKAYPNPFAEEVTFEFINENDAHAKLEIFNILGAILETVFDGNITGSKLNKVKFLPHSQLTGSQVVIYRLTLGDKSYVGRLTYQDRR